MMQVRLLGPVDLMADGRSRAVPGLRRTAVLAALSLRHRQVVSVDRLIEIIWDSAAPPTARNTLQRHVSYVRVLLGGNGSIRSQPPGYVLDLDGGTDVERVDQLVRLSLRAAGPADSARHLRAALDLWRGRPLADLAGLRWMDEQAAKLDLLHAQLVHALTEARLAAGEHQSLIGELEPLAARRPLDEQLWSQLMLALYRSGRQAAALAAYQALRSGLAEQLGVDPGQSVRDLEVAILQQDPALDLPVSAAGLSLRGSGALRPAQLPPVPGFAGREAELATLDALLPGAGDGDGPAAASIAALSGTAGVGKTTLALHWAHRASDRFPDGQLFVNLRGFDSAGLSVEPADALRGFLEAFGVPHTRIPPDLADRAGLYRSLLAAQRVLVVLDNARDAGQVRPLLPGAPGCRVLVTSRDRLDGLVVTEGARPVALDLLTPGDARDLLAARIGPDRIAREPAAVDTIITGCARLPLALTIAAARAATAPGFRLAAIAAELSEATHALDPFQGSDSATDVRSVFSWSYLALSTDAARLFRLLGLHPGPDISVAAAASLGALAPGPARRLLAELTRANLLSEHSPGRYRFHDLLRAYASEMTQAHDSQQVRDQAMARMLDHYLQTAHRAATLIDPHGELLAPGAATPGTVPASPGTTEEALAWFAAEQTAILSGVRLAAAADLGTPAWQLAWTVSTYLLRRGAWQANTRAQQISLAAARRDRDERGEAHAVHGLALAYARSGQFADALPYLRQALGLFESAGDPAGQARVHNSLIWIAEHDGRLDDALEHARQALTLYRAAGHQAGEALLLNDVGFCHARLGDYERALDYCQRGLAAIRAIADRNAEAAALDSLGYIHAGLGDSARAVASYEQAASMYAELADRFNEADTLVSLGNVWSAAGDLASARRTWTEALAIFDEIGHPDGDELRARLARAAETTRGRIGLCPATPHTTEPKSATTSLVTAHRWCACPAGQAAPPSTWVTWAA